MMVVMRLGIILAAFSAMNNHAMGIMVGNIRQKLGLAAATAIAFIATAFARRTAFHMLDNIMSFGSFRRNYNHIKLRHVFLLLLREELNSALSNPRRAYCRMRPLQS